MQTRERDRISNLAKSDPSAALHAARLLSDPFTKCQTLAWVARYTKTAADVVKVAGEAERALQATADPWEASAGAAWIVRALLERAQVREADVVLKRATTAARRLADTGRRVDGGPNGQVDVLDVLAGAVEKVADSYESFVSCVNAASWQEDFLLSRAVLDLHRAGKVPGRRECYAIAPHPALGGGPAGAIEVARVMVMSLNVWQSICRQTFGGPA